MTTAILTASVVTAINNDDCLNNEWSYQPEVIGPVIGDNGEVIDYNEVYSFCYYNPQGTSNIEEF